jgi:hypothetical protein
MRDIETTNNDDIIDIRDVLVEIDDIKITIDDLRAELDGLVERRDRLALLVDNVSGDGPLIRESYFTEYAQQMAEDIGAISKDSAWPACHIDWDEAADALKIDYTSVDFDGVTYYYRA